MMSHQKNAVSICRLLVVLAACICLPHTVEAAKQGQERLDSLLAAIPNAKEDSNKVMLYSVISVEYTYINPTEGLKWAKKELALSQEINWLPGKAYAYNDIGSNLEHLGAYPAALDAFFKALRIYEELHGEREICGISSNIGLLYQRQHDYAKALEWDLKALNIAKTIGDMDYILTIENNIGSVYQLQGNNDEALRYQLMSLQTAEKMNMKNVVAQLTNIGDTYRKMAQYAAALAYTFRAFRLSEEIGHVEGSAYSLGNAGETYYFIATASAPPQPDSLVAAGRHANLSQAVKYLRLAIAKCRSAQLREGIAEFSLYLSEALTAQGDYQSALPAYRDYIQTKDSLFNTANAAHIAQLETERAVALKDKDIQIAQLAVAKKRNERVFYISGMALLLVIIVIIVYNFYKHARSRQRIKELQDYKISRLNEAIKRRTEQLGSMRQTIATDFHDQTGNMLAAITRQAATLELKLLHQPEVLPMIRSIIRNSDELYASSKDFLWNLNHDSDDPLILFRYLSGYGQRFYNQFDISFSVTDNSGEQSAAQLQPFAGLNLIYIFKEAMNNVIKHSGADEVSMELRWEARQVVYSLQDNGTWKHPDQQSEHYGLANMERRCKHSGCTFSLLHGAMGTRIAIGVPVSADTPDNAANTTPTP